MLILAVLWCGVAAVAVSSDPDASKPVPQPPAAAATTPAAPTSAAGTTIAPPVAKTPKADPSLITVPSNTLGPGVPLWVVREQAESDARIARAEASYAEARAALARSEAQAAADRPDLYFGGGYGGYGGYGGVVVYGPHRAGLARAIANRPIPRPIVDHPKPPMRPRAEADDGFEDQHAVAQRIYADAARPRIEASVQAQQMAQRKFGENAKAPIAPIQRQRDEAQLKIRKAPKSGQ